MVDIAIKKDFSKRYSKFDIIGKDKYEKHDPNTGEFVAGNHFRMVLEDPLNMSEKQDIFGYEDCRYDDIQVRGGYREGGSGEAGKGTPWLVQNGNERFRLMIRSHAQNKAEKEDNLRRSAMYTEPTGELDEPGFSTEHDFRHNIDPDTPVRQQEYRRKIK